MLGLAFLGKNLSYDATGYVRQAIVATCMPISQSLMVQPHQVQNRCVEIVDMHGIFGHIDTVFIRFAIRYSWLDSRAG